MKSGEGETKAGDTVRVIGSRGTTKIRAILISMYGADEWKFAA
jgi:hypothetical protein